MSSQQQESEASGYNTSASSEFGSLEDSHQFVSPVTRHASKRRAVENVDHLDELMKSSMVLSPEKRLRLNTSNDSNLVRNTARSPDSSMNGRPQTRRSTSSDIEISPRVRAMRSTSGSSMDLVRTVSSFCTDSISPKFFTNHGSTTRKRTENGSIYSRHRLGATFSPLVAGAKRKMATPSQSLKRQEKQSPLESRHGGLRSRGTPQRKLLLCDRLKVLN
ncbi:uncharacterized protein CELE_B0304.2 [Caenorhabditis elegans]|uniref:Uncharacterized protein B0304.2 n=1 Tax=Caenorhabditis elegans TaxID=6239 RepID=YT22_CAEEL|nr:Uncharacterized protein CELE_B0304.2 [Caenorhabditis elegans]Q10932.1 RecName: Full=Uncharacterized protein B0304.2 [Caenorhabditis elegans]CCD61734.1 Uncharacterized protein CELE_B0304.2 [Caenorhabditis elegans]|eukprot:NP_494800.1 Uncharacterized protein CELE_B0304.2 [Caenorhabditis elegans]